MAKPLPNNMLLHCTQPDLIKVVKLINVYDISLPETSDSFDRFVSDL